jgi:hypothetical protein
VPIEGICWEAPLNINLNINNERQDCKIGTAWGGSTGGGERVKEEIKVRVYG